MLARNVSVEALEVAARSIDADLNELRPANAKRTAFRFTLRPLPGCNFRRVSASSFRPGRRVHAVCWHGHRDFFRKLFQYAPDAVITTALARYNAENFEDTFRASDRNIGSQIYPVYASEACDCPWAGHRG